MIYYNIKDVETLYNYTKKTRTLIDMNKFNTYITIYSKENGFHIRYALGSNTGDYIIPGIEFMERYNNAITQINTGMKDYVDEFQNIVFLLHKDENYKKFKKLYNIKNG